MDPDKKAYCLSCGRWHRRDEHPYETHEERLARPFTPEQEARIREIIREEAARANLIAGRLADEYWNPE